MSKVIDCPRIEALMAEFGAVMPSVEIAICLNGPWEWRISLEEGLIRMEVPCGEQDHAKAVVHLGRSDAVKLAAILVGLSKNCEESAL